MSKQIPLTQGFLATVDDADFDWLSQWKWRVRKSRKTIYACRDSKKGELQGQRRTIDMHLIINGRQLGMQTDHRDGNGLNNTRANLRIATIAQNAQNRRPVGASLYKGVCWHKREQKWLARIRINGKFIELGRFTNEKDAAAAYNTAAKNHFGEFAYVLRNDAQGGAA